MNIENIKKAIDNALEKLGGGVLSVGFREFNSGQTCFHNEDHIFPAASIVKVPIMLEYFHQIETNGLNPNEIVTLQDKDIVGGAGILMELHRGLPLTLRDLVRMMIVISDNTASNMMLDRLGMDEINAFSKSLGLEDTVIGRKFMIDPEAKFSKNFTSVRDMVNIYKKLYREEVLNAEHTKEAIEILSRQQYREKIPLLLPTKLKVSHKTGEITGVRHDCAIIFHEETPYTLCVLTEELPDVVKADRVIAELSLDIFNEVAKRDN